MLKIGKIGLGLTCLLLVLSTIARAVPVPDEIRPGEVTASVPCKGFPGQSYALYLPSAYTPERSWPIVYAFDPGAGGEIPVRLYREVAEKYGYILAGSNNSQNFRSESVNQVVQAMLADTHDRFALDPKRTYTTGFSGGARVATLVAVRCAACEVAGVVASGATYPTKFSPSKVDSFLYFMALGDTDFNYPEVVQTRLAKERFGSPYRVRLFPGPHQWAPAGVFEEAIVWFQIRAMRSGAIPKNDAFILDQQKQALAEAAQASQAHDSLREFLTYKSLVEDFQGLANNSDAEARLKSLRDSPELKKALEKERREVEMQNQLESEPAANVARFSADPVQSEPGLRASIETGMRSLRQGGQNSKDEGQRRAYERAFGTLFARIIEDGQQRKVAGKFAEALPFFELLTEAAPERAWPHLLIAETRVAMGDNKRALKAVRQAASTGRITAQVLEKDQELAPLLSSPDFQRIVDELKKHPPKAQ
jgi:dienelactone hydrolase